MTHRVAQHVPGHPWREVRELRVRAQRAFTEKAALLEHARGGAVVRMTERVQALEAELRGEIAHRSERLGRVPRAPGIVREHIARRRLHWRLEAEPGAAD